MAPSTGAVSATATRSIVPAVEAVMAASVFIASMAAMATTW